MNTPVHHLPTVDSTISEARRRLDFGEPAPFWIFADEQTAGRGRLGRAWVSASGNLYSTFVFTFTAPQATASQISFVGALAIHDVASSFITNADISLKWPNDCLINDAKFSGVLAEMHDGNMILGMGLNVLHHPTDLPYRATCLQNHAAKVALDDVKAVLQLKLKKWLQIWDNGNGYQHIHRAWEARCSAIGKPMSLDTGRTMLHGTFMGLAPDGGLVLNHDNTTSIHYAGDVRIVPIKEFPSI